MRLRYSLRQCSHLKAIKIEGDVAIIYKAGKEVGDKEALFPPLG